MNIMFGLFLAIPAVCPTLSQPGSIDSADAEPAMRPSVLRNSLLVCLFILVPFLRSCMDYLIIEKEYFSIFLYFMALSPVSPKVGVWNI